MSAATLPVVDLLCKVDRLGRDARATAVSILGIGLNSPIARALTENNGTRVCERHLHLLSEIHSIVASHRTKQLLTDWPFENFWNNPRKPLHSKLLGYFLDPQQEHGCGQFLLAVFLQVLEDSFNKSFRSGHRFPPDNCLVISEREFIDLRIERKCDDRRFAIILENKVNGAIDQDKQLQRYVEHLHRYHRFAYRNIYVFYLPLTGDKHPNPADRDWVIKSGAYYLQITFANEILRWLDSVLRDSDFRQNHQDICEGLTHYRNLNRKQKELEMNARILDQLKEAETRNSLPTLADLDAISQSITSLRACVKQVLRGRLLLAIRDMLQQQGHDVWMCLEKDPLQQAAINSPFDAAFGNSTNVCIRVSDTEHVCFGGAADHTFWLGYLRDGSSEQQAKICSVILDEANGQLGEKIDTTSPAWFAWAYRDGVYDENDGENSAAAISQRLVAMRKKLLERFDSVTI
jgi:hypothetical protein